MRRPGIRVALGGIDELPRARRAHLRDAAAADRPRPRGGRARPLADPDLRAAGAHDRGLPLPGRRRGASSAEARPDRPGRRRGGARARACPCRRGAPSPWTGGPARPPGRRTTPLDALAGVPAGWRFSGSSAASRGCPAGGPPRRSTATRAPRGSADFAAGRRPWLEVRAPRPFSVEPPGARTGAPRLPARRASCGSAARGTAWARGRRRRPRAGASDEQRSDGDPARARGTAGAAAQPARGGARRGAGPRPAPPAPRRERPLREPLWRAERPRRRRARRHRGHGLAGRPRRRAAAAHGGLRGGRLSHPPPAGATELSAPAGQRLSTRPPAPALGARRRRPPPREWSWTPATASTAAGGREAALDGPAWLVLGESYSQRLAGVVHRCRRRERALGEPEPADGFANGWRVDARCREARFAFAPQAAADVGTRCPAWLALLALALVGVAALRRRRPRAAARPRGQPVPPAPRVRIPAGALAQRAGARRRGGARGRLPLRAARGRRARPDGGGDAPPWGSAPDRLLAIATACSRPSP